VTTHAELLLHLQRAVIDTIGSVVDRSAPIALLDFPAYDNPGDSAIWLGELAALRSLGAERLVYTCDLRTFDADVLRHRIGRGTILLSGGGNFGDLWPAHQEFRERIIGGFPDNPIVQLPQSIHFDDVHAFHRARRVLSSHRALTLLVRDRRSEEIAANEFGTTVLLCPDAAFALGPLSRPGTPTDQVRWLCRSDAESLGGDWPSDARNRVDWAEAPGTVLGRVSRDLSDRLGRARPGARGMLRTLVSSTYRPLARQRLHRGVALISAASLLVTDRLHGHVLACLLGVPHVLVDNSYGKLRGFYDAWTASSPIVQWAGSPAEAASLVRQQAVLR
jgi:exopolysaccharide biosynthesis predicted pyruvyltransferase EpsI